MSLGKLTKLQGVNIALQSAQIAPVDSLSSGDIDANVAEQILDENTLEVQTRGWDFNTEELELSPDNNGEILLGNNFIKVDPVDPNENYIQRGNKLYNKDDNTFQFEEKVNLRIVVALEYEEIPQSFRRYIALKTSRIFQQRTLGDQSLNANIGEEERIAYAQILNEELESIDYNHIENANNTLRTVFRRDPQFDF